MYKIVGIRLPSDHVSKEEVVAAIERGTEAAVLLSRKDHLTVREAAKLFNRSESFIKKVVREKGLTRIKYMGGLSSATYYRKRELRKALGLIK